MNLINLRKNRKRMRVRLSLTFKMKLNLKPQMMFSNYLKRRTKRPLKRMSKEWMEKKSNYNLHDSKKIWIQVLCRKRYKPTRKSKRRKK
jgi:hypothetical protein